MAILGTIFAALVMILIPLGGILIAALAFGLLYSIYNRNREMHEDLQRIKAKLGIDDAGDHRLQEFTVAQELERSKHADPVERTKIDQEIERELEEYMRMNDTDSSDKDKK